MATSTDTQLLTYIVDAYRHMVDVYLQTVCGVTDTAYLFAQLLTHVVDAYLHGNVYSHT